MAAAAIDAARHPRGCRRRIGNRASVTGLSGTARAPAVAVDAATVRAIVTAAVRENHVAVAVYMKRPVGNAGLCGGIRSSSVNSRAVALLAGELIAGR